MKTKMISLVLGRNITEPKIGLPIIKDSARFEHLYIVGGTGTGKSTLILNLIYQDLRNDIGIIVLDPSGNLSRDILSFTPQKRDILYLSIDTPLSFNLFGCPWMDKWNVITEFKEVMNTYITLTTSTKETTSGMNSVLKNALSILLESEDGHDLKTLYNFLNYPNRRSYYLGQADKRKLADEIYFFENLAGEQKQTCKRVATRIGEFTTGNMYEIVSGVNQIDFEDIAKNRKILIVNCYAMGTHEMIFLGNWLSHGLKSYFMYSFKNRKAKYPIAFYVDEFQNFITPNFQKIISEGRKYKVSFIFAHTSHAQIPRKLLDLILDIINSYVIFNAGSELAERTAKELIVSDEFIETQELNPLKEEALRLFAINPHLIQNLPKYQFFARIGTDVFKVKGYYKPPRIKKNSLSKLSKAPSKPHTKPSEPEVYVSLWDGQPQFFTF